MSVTRTFTVTVSNPGSGNKYFIDGVQQDTINLAEGGTYVFNYPSAHPFKFSTTSDGTHNSGSEYTTGVTVNSSTQVQITVAASAPQLYYYCQYHSGMGGQANTVDPNTWGVFAWNDGEWGQQNDQTITLTGLSATFDSLTKVIISLLGLGIVVSLLGGNVPFVGDIASNITGLVQALGDAGIVGLVAAIIILGFYK